MEKCGLKEKWEKWIRIGVSFLYKVDTKGGEREKKKSEARRSESGDKDIVARCLTNEQRFRGGGKGDDQRQRDGQTPAQIDHPLFICQLSPLISDFDQTAAKGSQIKIDRQVFSPEGKGRRVSELAK